MPGPGLSWGWLILGRKNILKRYAEAIPAYQEALRLNPTFADARYQLGLTYFKQGQKEMALKEAMGLADLDAEKAEKLRNLIAGK